jgi:hypothetical protein
MEVGHRKFIVLMMQASYHFSSLTPTFVQAAHLDCSSHGSSGSYSKTMVPLLMLLLPLV